MDQTPMADGSVAHWFQYFARSKLTSFIGSPHSPECVERPVDGLRLVPIAVYDAIVAERDAAQARVLELEAQYKTAHDVSAHFPVDDDDGLADRSRALLTIAYPTHLLGGDKAR